MAARRCWVVFIDDNRKLTQVDNNIGGMFIPYGEDSQLLSVYFRETHATEAARYLATQNPGKDVHVLKQIFGFSSQARPAEYKEWTDDGQFLPTPA